MVRDEPCVHLNKLIKIIDLLESMARLALMSVSPGFSSRIQKQPL